MEQNMTSTQFEDNVLKIFDRLFKNKLTGKGYAIRLLAILALSFLVSGIALSMLTSQLNQMIYSENASALNLLPNFPSIIPLISGILIFVTFILTSSLSVRRVRDIVPDTAIWPYAVAVILIGLIPFIGYVMFFLLAILPSNYLTEEKRNQILGKFA